MYVQFNITARSHNVLTSPAIITEWYQFIRRQNFLDAFAKMRKATVSFLMSVRLSIRPHGITLLPLDGFSTNLISGYFRKSVEKIQVRLKSDKNIGYLTWRPMNKYDKISLINVSDKNCTQNQNIFYVQFFFRKSSHLWHNGERNIAQKDRPQKTIRRTRFAFWVTKATNTHSEHLIFIVFPLQQCLGKSASMLRSTYIPPCIAIKCCR